MSNGNSAPELWGFYLLGFRLEWGREPTAEEIPGLWEHFEEVLPDIRHGHGRRPYGGEIASRRASTTA